MCSYKPFTLVHTGMLLQWENLAFYSVYSLWYIYLLSQIYPLPLPKPIFLMGRPNLGISPDLGLRLGSINFAWSFLWLFFLLLSISFACALLKMLAGFVWVLIGRSESWTLYSFVYLFRLYISWRPYGPHEI